MLRHVYNDVLKKLEAQSVARHMFQSNSLTMMELQSVQSRHSEPMKAAKQLLKVVMSQSSNVFSRFLDSLKKTEQQQVYNVIVKGTYRGTMADVLAVSILSHLWELGKGVRFLCVTYGLYFMAILKYVRHCLLAVLHICHHLGYARPFLSSSRSKFKVIPGLCQLEIYLGIAIPR